MIPDTAVANPLFTASGETAIAWIFGGAVVFVALVVGIALRRRAMRGSDARSSSRPRA